MDSLGLNMYGSVSPSTTVVGAGCSLLGSIRGASPSTLMTRGGLGGTEGEEGKHKCHFPNMPQRNSKQLRKCEIRKLIQRIISKFSIMVNW